MRDVLRCSDYVPLLLAGALSLAWGLFLVL
jgi:hypothetical protein